MSSPITNPAKARKPPRARRRRLLWIVGVLGALLVLLILLAPTIITSRPGIGFIERMASARTGQSVSIKGLRFGWVTEFRLESLTVSSPSHLGEQPLLYAESVEVPLTLWRTLGGTPFDMDGVKVAVLEANAIRRDDGRWNFQDILDAFAVEDAEPTDSGPFVLPMSRIDARIDGIALRMIDKVESVEAGWVGGRVDIAWPGGTQPLMLDALGMISVGRSAVQWKLQSKLEGFVDEAGVVTPETMLLTATTGDMVNQGGIDDGGIFIKGGPGLRDEESIAHVVIPLQLVTQLLRDSDLQGSELIPETEGEIVLRLAAIPESGIARWQFDGSITGAGVLAQIEGYEDLPPIETTWDVAGLADLETLAVQDFALSGRLFGFETRVLAEQFSLSEVAPPRGLSMEASLDFAEASHAIATTAGGDPAGPTPLGGSLSFSARADAITTDEVIGTWEFAMQPGLLATMEPFAPWPEEQLGEAPLDLSPLSFALAGELRANLIDQQYEWSFERTHSDLVSAMEGRGHYNGATGDGNAELRKVVELAALSAAFDDILARAAGIDELDGRVFLETTHGLSESVTLISRGDLVVEDFRLGMTEAGLTLDEEEVSLEWDVHTHLPTAVATLDRVALNSEPANLTLAGRLTPEEVDLTLDGTLDFDAITARGFIPDGLALNGQVGMDLTARGAFEDSLDLELALDLGDDFAFVQDGVVQIYDSGALRAAVTVPIAEEPLRFTMLDISELSIGETLLATLDMEWAEDNTLSGTASMEGSVGAVLGMIDPAVFEAMELDVLAEGDGLVRSSFRGRVEHEELLGWQAVGDWIIDSDVAMELSFAEWLADWGHGLVEEASISHQVQISLPMDEGGSFHLRDSGIITAAFMDGVAGLTLDNASLESVFVMDDSGTTFTIERISTDGGFYATENMRVRIPTLAMNVETKWDPATQTAGALIWMLEESDLLEGDIRTTYRSETQRWEAAGNVSIASLAALMNIFEFDTPAPMPPMIGGAVFNFDLWGGIPGEASMASGHFPIGGTLEWDIAIDELDGGLDYQVGGLITGGRIDFEEEEGRTAISGRMVMREFANLALRSKPLRDIEAEFTADMEGFGAISWDLLDFRIGNYGTTARANGNIFDLDRALNTMTGDGTFRWLSDLAVDGQLRAEQDLSGFTGFMPLLAAGGVMDLSFDYRSAPDAALVTGGLVDLRNVEFHWGEMFHLEGANGSWEFAKSILIGPTARRPLPPPTGVITIDRIAFGLPPFMAEMRDNRTTMRGLESPITVDMTSRNLIGGTASATAVLRVLEGDPTLELRVQTTGLDVARMVLPEEAPIAVRRDWEVSAVSLASWRLRNVPGDRTLEDLIVSIQSTRIGSRAFVRLLQAMDPDGTDPSIQQSLSALRLGTPTAARANMRSGLMSFEADLRMTGGFQTILLPILNRQPIGDMLEVYQLRETMALVPLIRWGILLIMAEDFDTLERTLLQGGGTS